MPACSSVSASAPDTTGQAPITAAAHTAIPTAPTTTRTIATAATTAIRIGADRSFMAAGAGVAAGAITGVMIMITGAAATGAAVTGAATTTNRSNAQRA